MNLFEGRGLLRRPKRNDSALELEPSDLAGAYQGVGATLDLARMAYNSLIWASFWPVAASFQKANWAGGAVRVPKHAYVFSASETILRSAGFQTRWLQCRRRLGSRRHSRFGNLRHAKIGASALNRYARHPYLRSYNE
jgi:hypothetical protein